MKYLIIALIIIYSAWVIYRKIKRIKQGKFCSCDCQDCQSKCGKKE